MSNCYVYLPENLDIDSMLAKNPPTFKYNSDDITFLASLPLEISGSKKQYWKNSTYVPINSDLIQTYVHDYKPYFNYLLEHKVFETDNHYIRNEKSIGYKYSSTYNSFARKVSLNSYKYQKKIKRNKTLHFSNEIKLPRLKEWFNSNLRIDSNAAMEFLKKQYYSDSKNGFANAMSKYNANMINIDKLFNNHYHFKVDNNIQRLHTNITNLYSPLRNFITYGDLKLVNIDIKNSQPYLSSLLMESEFYDISKKSENYLNLNEIYQYTPPSKFPTLTHSSINNIITYIMSEEYSETRTVKGFSEYKRVVKKGKIYEWIQNEYFIRTGIKIVNRQQLKEIIFIVLFTDNRFIGQKEAFAKRIFKTIFPSTYKLFSLLKKKDKTVLPRLLQTIESYIILNKIVPRIGIERPDMPIFTIHDSIVCPVGNEVYVKAVMQEEFTKMIGYPPKFGFDYWDPSNAKIKKQ